jgi:hypothetical protein
MYSYDARNVKKNTFFWGGRPFFLKKRGYKN